jgi:uncharacterized integral membrane protein
MDSLSSDDEGRNQEPRERGRTMQFFFYLVFVIVIGIAIFAIQNSSAEPVVIRFLMWEFKTSLVYTLLGSIGLGVLITLLIWIPRALLASLRGKKRNRDPSSP